ncbi:MAG: alanine--tRNA ligase [Bacteroidales bacterium]|jgi:alanyl-tRNA synthetase|nr:alanine--tRNA ligase [Bacteroidales bacterium]
MNSKEIRSKFLNFFERKNHVIVPSAPMVIKNDPSLMFTNAGMNQFKDIFLGNNTAKNSRVTDSQKCLRVSGKHNDLEEVGHDTYHHTMFEMLGNWSFGDPSIPASGYFKKEAIEWAYEFLVTEMGIVPERIYATIFEGSTDDNLELDIEAQDHWKKYLPESRILNGSKKDNFWEMGETGPCGPCSELHIDLRNDEERKETPGSKLVNKDHPLVIEVWNLVFIQYNRKSNGSLDVLPSKHVDTGMGFERLCMALQGKKSNYDTDVFQPLIQSIAKAAGKIYEKNEQADIAMRVISDHLRAISFSIADGQLPSNVKAGYVIRRILRRAVRYGYTFLGFNEPFIYKLLNVLIEILGEAYPELINQKELIEKVIFEEETSFLKTLETGIRLLDKIIKNIEDEDYNVIPGKIAFELYDTYGFPFDLTELIAREHNLAVNKKEFEDEMESQKNRSRSAASVDTEDWIELLKDDVEEFVGYDFLETEIKITKYRKVKQKKKEFYQLVFNMSPFYAESGGQVGDKGYIEANGEKISILNTIKENNLSIHVTEKLPVDPKADFKAIVNSNKRISTTNNHTATHLLHYALRKVLGEHVEQKGSLVNPEHLRFDFSHFQKLTDDEIRNIEVLVNEKIRGNISLDEHRNIPIKVASGMGALALFGEKYGDTVRVIKFDDSVELCGGTHVSNTGQIGFFKIMHESSIASGIRRIEAITGEKVVEYVSTQIQELNEIKSLFKNPKNTIESVKSLFDEVAKLNKQIEESTKEQAQGIKKNLKDQIIKINGISFIGAKVGLNSAAAIKDLAFQLKNEIDNLVLVLGAEIESKANLSVMISETLVKEKGWDASQIIREVSKEIQGGGGGQAFYATAGGKKPEGLEAAIEKVKELIK